MGEEDLGPKLSFLSRNGKTEPQHRESGCCCRGAEPACADGAANALSPGTSLLPIDAKTVIQRLSGVCRFLSPFLNCS